MSKVYHNSGYYQNKRITVIIIMVMVTFISILPVGQTHAFIQQVKLLTCNPWGCCCNDANSVDSDIISNTCCCEVSELPDIPDLPCEFTINETPRIDNSVNVAVPVEIEPISSTYNRLFPKSTIGNRFQTNSLHILNSVFLI